MHEDKFLTHDSNPGYTGKTVNLDLRVLNFLNTTLVLGIRLRKKYASSLAIVGTSWQVDN
ncbi:hypothetical protein [Cylindrospermopsis raciborskii]|uniref:hypothetical protein n=1 Tax=Cylindrospermopsis raciborskii TaxID=77022 RepID=UPI001177F2B5|nr:hypothetical protein [Cylindrospermopsis raciborskii]MCZ2205126.1 hypothetical protein [Cylindrospermopsis raciborskii PAMP2011]